MVSTLDEEPPPSAADLDGHAVHADIHGSVWKIEVEVGQSVDAGMTLVILEAMKTELQVSAPVAGTVTAIHCRVGRQVASGDLLLVIATA